MKLSLAIWIGLTLAWSPSVHAIPNVFFGNGNFFGPVIPAQPRFNANLTREFLLAEAWNAGELAGPWDSNGETRRLTAMPVLFGEVPMSVEARSAGGRIEMVSITYLDAGPFFGYNPGGEDSGAERASGEARRTEFNAHFHRLSRSLRERLEAGCGRPQLASAGRSRLLRASYLDHGWEDFLLRLVIRPGHSVELRLLRERPDSPSLLDPALAALPPSDRRAHFAARVRPGDSGELLLEGIPMLPQGETPHCAVNTLAMVGRYFGLLLGAGELAAGANFRNTGSARGSQVHALHDAVAEEIGMNVAVSSRFDFRRARDSVSAGLPVIVWRRVSVEREELRAGRPEALSVHPANLPDRTKKGSPSHASIISGCHPETRELILTEPWGEHARHRRIHAAELEATVYAAYYFRW